MKIVSENRVPLSISAAVSIVLMVQSAISIWNFSNAASRMTAVKCFFGAFLTFLPFFVEKTAKLKISTALKIMYSAFILGAMFLGDALHFYITVPFWDDLMHGLSAVIIGVFGFNIFQHVLDKRGLCVHNFRILAVVFSFCLALSVGALWEVYEYIFDGILSLNMQVYLESASVPFTGRDALRDTMTDLIVDSVGAMISCVFCCLRLKNDWF